jgi:hypothetical protein
MHPDNIKALPPAIEAYRDVSKAIGEFVTNMNGNQPGDPKKAVEIMIDVVKGEGFAAGKTMPERLPLGPDALNVIRKKCNATLEVCNEWESVIMSTDMDMDETNR